ncbi:hypothetical protein C8K38_111212 [Rhodococcus sp. OK611]|uniref:hypothetical protein n=1 Tax=unclassified Rhodococcus (in: high G+C Gram-positive bacteria) TaxID=192944 RepID=UPI000BC9BB3B|nr:MULTISPECIES: hypothetical protein [unclassified Rhodococcus (in: high G+C Gram-positive bacteria)]PTR42043.1 hypothetical protein C8K38_111212 [Rhodococcus sp. OK611]SNX91510.1 hypothetical protein SAMN05447004_11045 [Rhodococcus sp. OK270]
MILAQAAAAPSQPNWTAIAGPIAIIFAAAIAGWVATRNSRKSPHENLKMLVEIRAELVAIEGDGAPLDAGQVVDRSIQAELNKLHKLNSAHDRGRFAYLQEKASQADFDDILRVIVQGLSILLFVAGVLNLIRTF